MILVTINFKQIKNLMILQMINKILMNLVTISFKQIKNLMILKMINKIMILMNLVTYKISFKQIKNLMILKMIKMISFLLNKKNNLIFSDFNKISKKFMIFKIMIKTKIKILK